MRGADLRQQQMFSYICLENRIAKELPLKPVRKLVDEVLREMHKEFGKEYCPVGRPSIASERLLRAMLPEEVF